MTNEEFAYLAGFLDGDGCIMLQLVRLRDYVCGYQIRASIVFYQKTSNAFFLDWLKAKLKHGYIRHRNDGMSEYTIVGTTTVLALIQKMYPYLRLKKRQAELAKSVLEKMPTGGQKMSPVLLLELAKEVDTFAVLNYSKRRTNTSMQVKQFLLSRQLLNPVETDS